MSSIAASGIFGIDNHRRRRPVTYGKQSRLKPQNFDNEVDEVERSQPIFSPHPTTPIFSTPSHQVSEEHEEHEEQDSPKNAFDVPLSDQEEKGEPPAKPTSKPMDIIGGVQAAGALAEGCDYFNVPSSDEEVKTGPHILKRRSPHIVKSLQAVSGVRKLPHSLGETYMKNKALSTKDKTTYTVHPSKRRKVADESLDVGEFQLAGNGHRKVPHIQGGAAKAPKTAQKFTRKNIADGSQDGGRFQCEDNRKALEKQEVKRRAPSEKARAMGKNQQSALAELDEMLADPGRPLRVGATRKATPEKVRLETRRAKSASSPVRERRKVTPIFEVKKVVTTPKQAKLWDSFLSVDAPPSSSINQKKVRSPRELAFRDGELLKDARDGVNVLARKSAVPAPQVRRRLIDTLVASAESTPSGSESDCKDNEDNTQDSQSSKSGTQQPVKPPSSQASQHTQAQASQQTQVGRAQARFTYAGQRSYLEDDDTSFDHLLLQPLLPEPETVMGRNSAKRNQEAGPFDLPDDEESTKAMRGVHELRAAGSSLRLEDDLMLADLDESGKSALSKKRSALLEWCNKLSDSEYRERFIQNGLEQKIVEKCSVETDPIVGCAVSGILAYVLGLPGPARTSQHLYDAGAVGFLTTMLDDNRDIMAITRDRRSNMSKVAQSSVYDFQTSIFHSPIWDNEPPKVLSPRLIASKSLEMLVRRLREDNNREPILNNSLLSKILQILNTALSESHGLFQPVSQLNRTYLRTMLSTLESFTVSESCALDTTLWTTSSLDLLINALDTATTITTPAETLEKDKMTEKQLVLRICLNLGNNNPTTCAAFARPTFISKIVALVNSGFKSLLLPKPNDKSCTNRSQLHQPQSDPAPISGTTPGTENDEDTRSQNTTIDTLLLSLGALFNLAEWSDPVRLVILNLPNHGLDEMISTFLFNRTKAKTVEDLEGASMNVAFGYLAVLLGGLCGSDQVRGHVASQLKKGTVGAAGLGKGKGKGRLGNGEGGLGTLLEAVEEFISHHQEADRLMRGNENWVGFTERLQGVAEGLREVV